jgi:2-phosphosulfolactate phosphatase
MEIGIYEFVEGAKKAKGIVVIIDVFRAFSVCCYAFDAGASQVIATGEIDEAFRLKEKYGNAILVGERSERKIEGFDLGNSPTEILKSDLNGKTIIHNTTAGTQGLINAVHAEILLTGSIVNASAIVKYIKQLNAEYVSLVAMGFRGNESTDEDLLCAEIISEGLKGNSKNFEKNISDLKYSSGKRFFEPENIIYSPPTDFFLCTMLNRFDFVLRAHKRDDGNILLERIKI